MLNSIKTKLSSVLSNYKVLYKYQTNYANLRTTRLRVLDEVPSRSASHIRCFNTTKLFGEGWSCFRSSNVLRPNIGLRNADIKSFKTSAKRDALPPVVIIVLNRVAKVVAMIFGRTFRRWWQKLPPEQRAKYSSIVRRNRYIISGTLGALAFGSFVYYETHVQETPFTKRKRFLAFTEDQFNEMSKYELELMLQIHKDRIIPASMSVPAYRRVVHVAQKLLKANTDVPQIHDKEWSITVVDEDHQANAFVLPCGSIFVFSGLLKLCESDDELGIILGHEMAHAVMGHGAEKASLLHFLDWMLVIPLAALWAFLPTDLIAGLGHFITTTVTTIVMELPHSRLVEHEADEVGLTLASKACFDVRTALILWEKMSLVANTMPELQIEWLSTHPSHDKRQSQIEDLLPDALVVREKCLCPRLPFFDAQAKVLEFQKKLKLATKHPHEGLLLPVKIT